MRVIVRDNDGETFDRYTIIIGRDVYGASENPFHPQGFGQFSHTMEKHDRSTLAHCGKRVKDISTLPYHVIRYVSQLVAGY